MKLSELAFKTSGIALLIGCLAGGWFVLDLFTFKRNPMQLDSTHSFIIEPGTSLSAVARDLHNQGLIENPKYLVILGRWHGHAANIKAGEYLLQPGTRPLEFLDMVVAGDVIQYAFTIVEGWTFRQMLHALAAEAKIKPTLMDLTDEQIMERLGAAGEHPEGRFLPETYHYTTGMTDVAFLKRAQQAMTALLATEWDQREQGLPYSSAYEALIMASIIEKETGAPEERAEIAGVFVRRLQKGMRLQTDPTVIYGMGASFDGNIRRRDLSQDTPYNTYTRHGLPPTPIALPGADAIRAALHPASGDALYFVSRGDGSHYFSASLEEHINAVRKYQLGK